MSAGVMNPAAATTELRLPADPDYIVVAKRAAAGIGSVAGFDVDAIDDLVIAIAEACENAIAVAMRAGPGRGQIRVSFKLDTRGLEVQVRSLCAKGDEGQECSPEQRRAMAAEAMRLQAIRTREALDAQDLALRVMGLFVDDFRYRVDARTGGLQVRLRKYLY